MRVVRVSLAGVQPAGPVRASHPTRGAYWRFEHGEVGRGRKLVVFPLGQRDFPAAEGNPAPGPETEYRLLPVSEGRAHILVRGRADGSLLVLWSLSPGFRGSATYAVAGQAVVIAEGYQAQGDAGRMGGRAVPVRPRDWPMPVHVAPEWPFVRHSGGVGRDLRRRVVGHRPDHDRVVRDRGGVRRLAASPSAAMTRGG